MPGSTQPLTEMSIRDFPGGKGRPPSVSRFSRKCGILDVSQTFAKPRPLTGAALPVPVRKLRVHIDIVIIKLRRNPQFSLFTFLG
jgi:hypothetical protein